MNKFGTIFLMVCSLLITACENKNSYVIEYSTTGCFRTCPILDIKQINDSLYFNFIKHNDRVGLFYVKLTKDQIEEISFLIKQILDEDIQKEYWSEIDDVPSTLFRLKLKNVNIESYYDDHIAPIEIDTLYKYLISISNEDLKKIQNTKIDISTRKEVDFDTYRLPPPPPPPIDNSDLESN